MKKQVNEDKNSIIPSGKAPQDNLLSAGFTPGPWQAIKHVQNLVEIAFESGSIATVARFSYGSAGDAAENNANATLIAAAPSLYETTKSIASVIHCPNCPDQGYFAAGSNAGGWEPEQCQFCYTHPDSLFNLKEKARAALALVEGLSPAK